LDRDFDCIVVGGGIAGLSTALRLALNGIRVVVLEKDRLGSGATVGNHGTIHSGALYALEHPQLSRQCQEALAAYRKSFPRAQVPVAMSWYFADGPRLLAFERCWHEQGIAYDTVERALVDDVLLTSAGDTRRCVAISDHIVSSRGILLDLAQRCLDAGVVLATSTPVREVHAGGGRCPAVRIGLRESLTAEHVVLGCGLGIAPLLRPLGSSLCRRLRSRLAVMAVLPNLRLDRALFCLENTGPTVVPTTDGMALASLFGGLQPGIDELGRWPIPLALADHVLGQLGWCVRPDVVDAAGAWGYVCSKTELEAAPGDPWRGGPNYAVVDHGAQDGLDGLWSLIPGKMTVALHASRDLVARMYRIASELTLPPAGDRVTERAKRLVAQQPWQTARASAVEWQPGDAGVAAGD